VQNQDDAAIQSFFKKCANVAMAIFAKRAKSSFFYVGFLRIKHIDITRVFR
jgi:hypothetical protein